MKPSLTATKDDIKLENLRKTGEKPFFEYHCWESHQSSDAQLWYRSHQQITILNLLDDCDGKIIASQKERLETGCILVYKVQWKDGHIGDATEDELLDSPTEYTRPTPPKPQTGEKG